MSCVVGCPYEGEIAPGRVGMLAGLMKDIGVQHVGVADTIGVGTPLKVQRAMEATLQHYAINDVSGHFHDTYGQALANTLACLQKMQYVIDVPEDIRVKAFNAVDRMIKIGGMGKKD